MFWILPGKKYIYAREVSYRHTNIIQVTKANLYTLLEVIVSDNIYFISSLFILIYFFVCLFVYYFCVYGGVHIAIQSPGEDSMFPDLPLSIFS